MIDTTTAIDYLKQVVTSLDTQRKQLLIDSDTVENQKAKIIQDRASLTASKSAFLTQTGTMTAKVEKAEKLHALATKMKQQVDQQLEELTAKELALSKREEAVTELEELKKILDERKKSIEIKEAELAEKELIIERDKKLVMQDKEALREKQSFLDLQKKGILRKQEKLQNMIEAQKV